MGSEPPATHYHLNHSKGSAEGCELSPGTHATPYKDLLRPLLSPTPGPTLGDRSLTFMPATSMRVRTWNWAPTWRTRGTQYRSMLLNWEDMGVAWAAAQGPSCDPATTPPPPFWLQSRLVMWDVGENMAV